MNRQTNNERDRAMSWIISHPKSPEKRMEVFSPKTAEACRNAGLNVEPIAEYLGNLNRQIKEGSNQ